MTELINDKSVYRTAPVTSGLLKILVIQGKGSICMAIQLYENVCHMIADTQAWLSALELG